MRNYSTSDGVAKLISCKPQKLKFTSLLNRSLSKALSLINNNCDNKTQIIIKKTIDRLKCIQTVPSKYTIFLF